MSASPDRAGTAAPTPYKSLRRVGLVSSGIVAAVLACVAYLELRVQRGSDEKSAAVLQSAQGCPRALMLAEVADANLLVVLKQKRVQLGRHELSMHVDEEQRARICIHACENGDTIECVLHEQEVAANAIAQALREPQHSRVGLALKQEGDEYVVHLSVAGMIAKVATSDIDAALGKLLEQSSAQQGEGGVVTLALPYRSRLAFCRDDCVGTHVVELRVVRKQAAAVKSD